MFFRLLPGMIVTVCCQLALMTPECALAEDVIFADRRLTKETMWSELRASDRKVVVVYMALDLDPGVEYRNALRLATWLREPQNIDLNSAQRSKLSRAGVLIEADLVRFDEAVDEETTWLVEHLAKPQRDIGLAIFRNQGMATFFREPLQPTLQRLTLNWTAYLPGEIRRVEEFNPLFVNESENSFRRFLGQPLAVDFCFTRALEDLRRVFRGREHQFILIIKSRGCSPYIMEPYLPLEIEKIGPAKLVEQVLAFPDDLEKPSRTTVARLLRHLADAFPDDTLSINGEKNLPAAPFANRYEWLHNVNLMAGGNDGFYSPLIVFDSPYSGFDYDTPSNLKGFLARPTGLPAPLYNVGLVYTCGHLDSYRVLPFERLFELGGVHEHFPTQFKEKLLDTIARKEIPGNRE